MMHASASALFGGTSTYRSAAANVPRATQLPRPGPATPAQCSVHNKQCAQHAAARSSNTLTAAPHTAPSTRARARRGCSRTCRATANPADVDVQQQQPSQEQEPQQPQQSQQQPPEPASPRVPMKQRLSACPVCGGSGRITCADCQGAGVLGRGGYSRRNPLNQQRAIGSKWTAMTTTLGWRHFRVTAVRKLGAGRHAHMFLLLAASCDSQQQLWVNAQTLRNRLCFAAGWLQMRELGDDADASEGAAAGGGGAGRQCQVCSGLGWKACAACDGRGRAILVDL